MIKTLILSVIFCFLINQVEANGYRVGLQSNRALAMGNTGVAVIDNAGLDVLNLADISLGTEILSPTFITDGAFSLDGAHLTPRGYALIANKTSEAINHTYGSTLLMVNLGDFRTIAKSDNTD